ncbi:MAG: phosphatase PAP2 family protein [Mycobacteriales bacterium]
MPSLAPRSRVYGLAVALAVGSSLLAITVASVLDLPIRDPDGIAGPAWVRLPLIVFAFFVADVLPRALLRAGGLFGVRRALNDVVRERWDRRRSLLVAIGLGSFYATYVSYRNLKGALPFARDRLHDAALLDLDRAMLFGADPSTVLHTLLGTGWAAYVLSVVYLLFLAFVPVSLGAALVWARNIRVGALWVTALCLNWLLGAASYYLLPSLGPVFVRPALFADLPETGVSALQSSLLEARLEVLTDPIGATAIQGVAGFASLHVSIVFTGVLVAHRLGMHRVIRWAMWVFLVLTTLSTVYFGWHYLVDDIAGLGIGALSVWLAAKVTERAPALPPADALTPSSCAPALAS